MAAKEFTEREDHVEGTYSRRDIYSRISEIEKEISGFAATLSNFSDLLREVRNEMTRPRPGTNWVGVVTLALAMIGGGAIYVQTQIIPLDKEVVFLIHDLKELRAQQFRDAKAQSEADINIAWLTKLEDRAYDQRKGLRRDLGKAYGMELNENE